MALAGRQYRTRHQTPRHNKLLHEQLDPHDFFLLGRIVQGPWWRFRPGLLTEAQLTIILAAFPLSRAYVLCDRTDVGRTTTAEFEVPQAYPI
ncbi:MAG: hypothetical protein ABL965_14900 [Nitrospira sp.]